MSYRTIIELNHDFVDAIKRDPIGFAQSMLDQCRAANNPETIADLRRYGVIVVETVHHSTPRKVVLPFGEYPL